MFCKGHLYTYRKVFLIMSVSGWLLALYGSRMGTRLLLNPITVTALLLILVIHQKESIVAFDIRIDALVSLFPHVLLQRGPILELLLTEQTDELVHLLLHRFDEFIHINEIFRFAQLKKVLAEQVLQIDRTCRTNYVATVQTHALETCVRSFELMLGHCRL